jgi:LysM repeat protein
VWQFRHDGDREAIRESLAAHDLGIALKTHDGTRWMSQFDTSPHAVSGPEKIAELASFFESGGVPFHAWYNAHGIDPLTEAGMASDVLNAGARSMFIDLEPHRGFWQGTPETAASFGEELRRLQPAAWLSTSIDPRPWEIGNIPLAEFAAFSNEIAPQVYWSDFRNAANLNRFRREGHDPGPAGIEGITPGFVLAAAMPQLSEFGLPIHPIGDGSVVADDGWADFLAESFALEANAVSAWRFGNIEPRILQLLKETPPRVSAYTVRPGDTLGALAAEWGVDVGELVEANGITNPNLIAVGQRLIVPRRGAGRDQIAAVPSPAASSDGGGSYTVQPGDAVWTLALEWDTTVEAIALANGLSDPSLIRVGDTLLIP